MSRRAMAAAAVAAALLSTTPAAAAADPCHQAARWAAERTGVPEALLRGIIETESSGRPWALNIGGRALYPETARAAAGMIRQAEARGITLDVGCAQLNTRWHGSGLKILTPRANLLRAARFLVHLRGKAGSMAEAVGWYHSRRPKLARAYRCHVARKIEPTTQCGPGR